MTKYTDHYAKESRSLHEKAAPHPIWRGIGLIMLIVLPVMSYLIVTYFLQNPSLVPWLEIPEQIIFKTIWDPFIVVKLIGTILLTFIFFVVISVFTFIINSMFGTSKG